MSKQEQIQLSSDNIIQWKRQLDCLMEELGVKNYSNTKTDKEWIDEYIDYCPIAVVEDETDYWEE